jgi:hypothetical protein
VWQGQCPRSQPLRRQFVQPKLQWRPQNVGGARNVEHLLRKDASQPQRETMVQGQRGGAAQAWWNSYHATVCHGCQTWSYRIWCLLCWVLVQSFLAVFCLSFLEWECFLRAVASWKYTIYFWILQRFTAKRLP